MFFFSEQLSFQTALKVSKEVLAWAGEHRSQFTQNPAKALLSRSDDFERAGTKAKEIVQKFTKAAVGRGVQMTEAFLQNAFVVMEEMQTYRKAKSENDGLTSRFIQALQRRAGKLQRRAGRLLQPEALRKVFRSFQEYGLAEDAEELDRKVTLAEVKAKGA